MESRNTLGLGRKPALPPRFKITLTGPAKGPPPVEILIEAPSAKAACEGLKRLVALGKLKVEAA